MEETIKDIQEMDKAIEYFQTIVGNISNYASHKMAATFIGIKTNISGTLKLHIYILLFPFPQNDQVVPYSDCLPNVYMKDICFSVDKSFYLWLYEEMKKQNSIVIMTIDSYILKVLEGKGDTVLNIDNNCNELKDWTKLNYIEWYEKQTFHNVFTIKITNPFLYMVPFPVKPIIIQTIKKLNNYITIIK